MGKKTRGGLNIQELSPKILYSQDFNYRIK